jgi:hypothetical protein
MFGGIAEYSSGTVEASGGDAVEKPCETAGAFSAFA